MNIFDDLLQLIGQAPKNSPIVIRAGSDSRSPLHKLLGRDDRDIEALNIGYFHSVKETEKALAQVRNIKSLKRLALVSNPATESILKNLDNLSGLEDLNICNGKISDQNLMKLSALSNLRSLGLHSSGIQGIGLKGLRQLPNLRSLTIRAFTHCINPGEMLRELGELNQLEHLSLWLHSDPEPENLRCLGNLQALKTLQLEGSFLSSPQLACLGNLTNIESLSLVSPGNISEQGLESLSRTNLKRLDIKPPMNMSPQAWTHLCGITSLESLKFGWMRIDDNQETPPRLLQFKELQELTRLANLKRLHIWESFAVPETSDHSSFTILSWMRRFDNLEHIDFRQR